jgi:CelD/BcsL family acetyltransferase involved in cellulose biosynthesis
MNGSTAPVESTVRVFREWEQIRAEAGDWNQLAGGNFMLRTEWLQSWWEAFRNPGDQLAVIAWSDPARGWRGLLPGFVTRGLLGRTYRLLGSGNVCTDYVRLLESEVEQTRFAQLAAKCLTSPSFRQAFGRLDAVELEGQLQGEPSLGNLASGLREAGWVEEERELAGTWRVKLPGTLEEFIARLPKSRRRKVNKARRLLAEGQVSYEAIWDWPRIDSMWSEFVRLHQKRREVMGQPGCFFDPRFGKFLRSAVQRFSEREGCCMGVLWASGQPVGMNLIFLEGTTANMYQSGMEPERSELEPGHLMNYFTMGTAIERGAEWFDFLRGDEPYKEGWGAERQVLCRKRLFAPHLSARLRQTALAAGRGIKAWSASWLSQPGETPVVNSGD